MNEPFFIEEDYDSDSLSEKKPELEIFHDPFFEIGPYLHQDTNIKNNSNLEELIFFFKSAWLDPYFYRNRTSCSLPTNDYLPEEKGLLILIQKLLGLNPEEPLDHHLLTIFCMITGRCLELLKFDKITYANIYTVNFRAPFLLYSQFGEGPCCITPYLIVLAINETVTFPSIVTFYEKHKLTSKNSIEVTKKVTTDLKKSFKYALRDPPKLFPLSFDSGLTLTSIVQRFPMSDGGFWVRITCDPFSIAYGSDISNGKGKIKFPWVNRFNGSQPPTLSENGVDVEVEWTDEPIYDKDVLDYFKSYFGDEPDKESLNYCPISCPDPTSTFRSILNKYRKEVKNYRTIWPDPKTGRINEKDMKYLLMDEEDMILIVAECNNFCMCDRNCPCRITCRPQFPGMMLFYSPDKNWGVVATEDIEPGSLITVYAGEHKSDEFIIDDKWHVYQWALEFGDNDTKYNIHALRKCNIGRFINQSCNSPSDSESPFKQPNAVAKKISSPFIEMCSIGYFSTRKIFKGEEINIFYGEHYKMTKSCACNICMSDVDKYKKMLSDFK